MDALAQCSKTYYGDDVATPKVKPSLVIVLAILAMVGPFTADMYLPTFPGISRDFNASSASVQLTLSLFTVGMGIGQLWWGPFSDAIGRRGPLVFSTIAFIVVSLLAAMAPNILLFTLLRFLQGFIGSAGVVIGRAIARDLRTGRQLAQLLSVLGMIMGIAPVVAPVIGGLVAKSWGWHGVMLFLMCLGIVMAAGTLLYVRESRPVQARTVMSLVGYKQALGEVCRDRAFVGYTIAMVFAFGALFAYVSGSSFVLQAEYGLSPSQYSLFIGANALGLLTGGVSNSVLVKRISPAKILRYCIAHITVLNLITLTVVLLAGKPHPVVWQALVLLSTFVTPMIIANATTLALSPHGKYAGMASAVMGAAQFIVAGVVTVLVALGGNPTSSSVALVMASVAVISAVAFVTIVPRHQQK